MCLCSWLDELAISSFEWCYIANIHEAGSMCAQRALVEPAIRVLLSSQLHSVNGILVAMYHSNIFSFVRLVRQIQKAEVIRCS